MSPESGILNELRFELHGHQIVAYLPLVRRRSDVAVAGPPEPTRWRITLDGGEVFDGPVYLGYLRSEAAAAEVELRAFLEADPRMRELE